MCRRSGTSLMSTSVTAKASSNKSRPSMEGGDTEFNVDDEVVAALALGTLGLQVQVEAHACKYNMLQTPEGQANRATRATAPRNLELPKQVVAAHAKLRRKDVLESCESPSRKVHQPSTTPIKSPPAKKSKPTGSSSESLGTTTASSEEDAENLRKRKSSGHTGQACV